MTVVINDLHIGTIRSAGTTPASALALRKYALESLKQMLDNIDENLVILGDLFDTYSVPMQDLLETYTLLSKWCAKGHCLTLVPGNHDLSSDSSKMSSFEFLSKLLLSQPNVQYIQGGDWVDDDIYAVSHVHNQDLLNLELSKVPKCRFLLLHANYDNHFAKESDHSLNVSEEQARTCKAEVVCFAHEHNTRTALNGKVYVFGNQFPMSISDCLDGHDKFMHQLDSTVYPIKTWDRSTNYQELDWRNPQTSEAKFIRFVGSATAEEAAAASEVIARYRRTSQAFVVGNGVKVQSAEGQAELEVASLEQVRSFDVMSALKDYLTEKEYNKLQTLPI